MYNQVLEYLFIIAGALILYRSFVKLEKVYSLLPLIQEPSRASLLMYIRIQRVLIIFFMAGYFTIAITMYIGLEDVSVGLVSVIFLLVAAFVYIGAIIKGKMTSEIIKTIERLIPICSDCKKIQNANSDPVNQSSWIPVDQYLTQEAKVRFTHGLCPACEDKMRQAYKKNKS